MESNLYKCYINGKERQTQLSGQGLVQCSTPPKDQLPSVSSDTGTLADIMIAFYLIGLIFENTANTTS